MLRFLVLPALLLAFAGCGPSADVHQGVIEFDQETLAFEVAGTLSSMPVPEGARARADAVVATLAGDDLRLAEAEAAAAVVQAECRLAAAAAQTRPQELGSAAAEAESAVLIAANATSELTRQQRLQAEGLVSIQAVERVADTAALANAQARSATERLALLREGPRSEDVAVAQAALALARASADRASQRVAQCELRIPAERLVRHHLHHPGEVVLAGVPVVAVADPDHPYVDAFVPQAGLAALRVGGPASVRVDGGAPVAGTIERIGERLEFTPRFLFGPKDRPDLVARVRVRLASGEGLHAGVPADVRFGR